MPVKLMSLFPWIQKQHWLLAPPMLLWVAVVAVLVILLSSMWRLRPYSDLWSKFASWFLTILIIGVLVAIVQRLLPGKLSDPTEWRTWWQSENPQWVFAILVSILLSGIVLAYLQTAQKLVFTWKGHRRRYCRDLLRAASRKKQPKEPFLADLLPTEVLLDDGIVEEFETLAIKRIRERKKQACKMLVVGEAGSGKSIGMESLQFLLARSGRTFLPFSEAPIPILLRLGDLKQSKLLEQIKDVLINQSYDGKFLAAELDMLMDLGRVVLLLDGLDENGSPGLFAELHPLLFSAKYGRLPVVISTRPRAYPEEWDGKLTRLEVRELRDQSIRKFIKSCLSAEENADEVLEKLDRSSLLEAGGLGRNPFWLPLILRGKIFQENRAAILIKGIDAILQREWDHSPSELSNWNRRIGRSEQLAFTKQALGWLAYQFSTGNREWAITQKKAVDLLETWKKERTDACDIKSLDIIGLAIASQLLKVDTAKSYLESPPLKFRHELLREFFSAAHLEADPLSLQEAVNNYGADPAWWGVFLLLDELYCLEDELGLRRHAERIRLQEALIGDKIDIHRLFLVASLCRRGFDRIDNRDRAVIDSLANRLRSGVTIEVEQAAQTLSRLDLRRSVEVLRELMESGHLDVQQSAQSVLSTVICRELLESKAVFVIAAYLEDHRLRESVGKALSSIGEPAMELLERLLGHEQQLVQCKAAQVLGNIGNPRAIASLTELLNDPERLVKTAAVEALGAIGVPVIQPLVELAKKDELWLALPVAKALARMGEPAVMPLIKLLTRGGFSGLFAADALAEIGSPAVDPVLLALRTVDFLDRISLVSVLGEIRDPRSVDTLVGLLDWHNYGENLVAIQAQKALRSIGSAAASALVKALRQGSVRSRVMAAEVLGKIGEAEAFEPLIQCLQEDTEVLVRAAAARALGEMGEVQAIGPLLTSTREPYMLVWMSAAMALVRLGKQDFLQYLVQALQSDQGDAIRIEATELLGDLGGVARPAVPVLLEALKENGSNVRTFVLDALGKIGIQDCQGIDAICAMLDDDDQKVKALAAKVLGGCGESISEEQVLKLGSVAESSDKDPALAALNALTRIGRQAASVVPILVKLLTHADFDIRMEALRALAAIGPAANGAVEELAAALKNFRTDELAARALGEIGSGAARAVPALCARLKSSPSTHKVEIIRSLRKIGVGSEQVVAALSNELKESDDEELRNEVAQTLRTLAPRAAQDMGIN